MTVLASTVTLNNGREIPVLGLGTYKLLGSAAVDAVKIAIDAGYRHIDTAYFYGNEREVGQAIRDKIQEGVIKREDIFVTTKLWSSFHERVSEGFQISLDNLNLEYIDLFLMHAPVGHDIDADGRNILNNVDYVDTWKAMEKLLDGGKVRSLGVSNFNSEQITRILEHGTVKPVTNQVECSPRLNQKKLIKFCKDRDIYITAYSPLGRPSADVLNPTMSPTTILEEPQVTVIAEKYGKTSAQVVLRYLIDNGTIPIPKSGNAERIRQNIDVFDFELSADELASMDTLNKNLRVVPFLSAIDHQYYPFKAEF